MKVYVAVELTIDESGVMHPRRILWEDGRRFEITSVSDVRRAASLKAGGSGMRYTVRNTIAIIMAKPARSVGKNTVPSMRALVMVAETGSMVPMRLARTEPISLTPCI